MQFYVAKNLGISYLSILITCIVHLQCTVIHKILNLLMISWMIRDEIMSTKIDMLINDRHINLGN